MRECKLYFCSWWIVKALKNIDYPMFAWFLFIFACIKLLRQVKRFRDGYHQT